MVRASCAKATDTLKSRAPQRLTALTPRASPTQRMADAGRDALIARKELLRQRNGALGWQGLSSPRPGSPGPQIQYADPGSQRRPSPYGGSPGPQSAYGPQHPSAYRAPYSGSPGPQSPFGAPHVGSLYGHMSQVLLFPCLDVRHSNPTTLTQRWNCKFSVGPRWLRSGLWWILPRERAHRCRDSHWMADTRIGAGLAQ